MSRRCLPVRAVICLTPAARSLATFGSSSAARPGCSGRIGGGFRRCLSGRERDWQDGHEDGEREGSQSRAVHGRHLLGNDRQMFGLGDAPVNDDSLTR